MKWDLSGGWPHCHTSSSPCALAGLNIPYLHPNPELRGSSMCHEVTCLCSWAVPVISSQCCFAPHKHTFHSPRLFSQWNLHTSVDRVGQIGRTNVKKNRGIWDWVQLRECRLLTPWRYPRVSLWASRCRSRMAQLFWRLHGVHVKCMPMSLAPQDRANGTRFLHEGNETQTWPGELHCILLLSCNLSKSFQHHL